MATREELTLELELLHIQATGLGQVWQKAGEALDAIRARIREAQSELAAVMEGWPVPTTAKDAEVKVALVDDLLTTKIADLGRGGIAVKPTEEEVIPA